MRTIRRIILFAAATAAPLLAADINGSWKFDGEVSGNPIRLDCAIKQDGEKFFGTCKAAEGGEIKLEGSIAGDKIRFAYQVDYQGTIYTLAYTGVVKDNAEMKGEIEVANTGGTFTAKKQGA